MRSFRGRPRLFGGGGRVDGGDRSGLARHKVEVGAQAVTGTLDLDDDGMVLDL